MSTVTNIRTPKHERFVVYTSDRDPVSRAECDGLAFCPRCNPQKYAAYTAEHRKDKP